MYKVSWDASTWVYANMVEDQDWDATRGDPHMGRPGVVRNSVRKTCASLPGLIPELAPPRHRSSAQVLQHCGRSEVRSKGRSAHDPPRCPQPYGPRSGGRTAGAHAGCVERGARGNVRRSLTYSRTTRRQDQQSTRRPDGSRRPRVRATPSRNCLKSKQRGQMHRRSKVQTPSQHHGRSGMGRAQRAFHQRPKSVWRPPSSGRYCKPRPQ